MDDTHTNQQSSHLYAIMLKLRARGAGDILPNAGQLAHAALLAWLAAVDPALATRLHAPNNDRPFTCSSLWFPDEREVAAAQRANRRLPIRPERTYWLRLTLLTDELFRTLTARFLQPAPRSTPGDLCLPALRLGSVQFDVAELLALAPDPASAHRAAPEAWAGYDTYEGIVARAGALDVAAPAGSTIAMEFRSPTAFSDNQLAWGKRMHLFPDPDRVFDRLARVWNAWAPPALALDARALVAYIREWVAVAQYELATRTLHFDRHAQVGFVGRCMYALMARRAAPAASSETIGTVGAGLSAAQALHLLAAFSFFAGVGQKTSMGMGQARPLTALTPPAPAAAPPPSATPPTLTPAP